MVSSSNEEGGLDCLGEETAPIVVNLKGMCMKRFALLEPS